MSIFSCYYISCCVNVIGKILAYRWFGQAHLNDVDLGPMVIKVNVVSSVIVSTLSLLIGISQLHAHGRMLSEQVVDIVLIYKLMRTFIRTHFMEFFKHTVSLLV